MILLYIKEKYFWYKNYFILQSFLRIINEKKILLYGYPKSGNTWLRFLIINYYNLLIDDKEKNIITFDKLNQIQSNILDRGTTIMPVRGFPFIYRTHKKYIKSYLLFDKKIFIHRNPLDTLISSYYFYRNRNIPFSDEKKEIRNKMLDINFYVKIKIDEWIEFYYTSIKYADIVINYSDLKNHPEIELTRIINFLNGEYNRDFIVKSIHSSSFENINLMASKYSQEYGNGPKDGSFYGKFTRSGVEGQFNNELSTETINFVLKKFKDFKNIYPDLID